MQSCFISFLIVLLDVITEKGFHKIFPQFGTRHRRAIRKALIIQAAASVAIIIGGSIFQQYIGDYRIIAVYYYIFGLIVTIYLPKAIFVSFLFAGRSISWIRERRGKRSEKPRDILAKCGFWTGLAAIAIVIWGIFFGRFNFTIHHEKICDSNLPPSFNGYKIVQFTDVHAGSFFGSAERFREAVDKINDQAPDLIVFTGDMVNNFADEAVPIIPFFSQLKARDGKYAVLGNHDYGGYTQWKNPADSVANHEALKNAITQMGFELLQNRSVVISRSDSARIALIGTENWGVKKRYPKRANLTKAMQSVNDIPFRVLLSHDPSYWPQEVKGKTDIALTLSGHTHGMQTGVKLGKRHYSFAFFRFPYWGGLYQTGRQYLYVNCGLGVIAFPGRIGMSPEITVITLWNEEQN